MPFVTVRVSKPANRLVFINGDYSTSAGNSNDSFTVPTGGQVFETLTADRCVDFRKSFRVRPADADSGVTVELDRVDPPEPI